MFDTLKKKLYFAKTEVLFNDGISKGDIQPFEDDLYNRLNHVYFAGIPLSIQLKYLKPLIRPGKCFDRSLFITTGFEDSILVIGNNKRLELKYGKENAGHVWVERGEWVYDPTHLLKFKKELYYKIYEPTNVSYYTKEEYTTNPIYQDIITTTLEDLMRTGRKRHELLTSVPLVQGIAEMSNNQDFIKLLDEFLTLINYDVNEINNELDNNISNILKTKKR